MSPRHAALFAVTAITAATLAACREDTSCTATCDPHASCVNKACVCDPGYSGDGASCADVNECATANGGCATDAVCINVSGSSGCFCKAGFQGDGKTCTDVDECATASTCGANATCTNTPGSFRCACAAGFTGDGQACSDVNECATLNGGCSDDAVCTNTPGARTCACQVGFTGDGGTCADVDECTTTDAGCGANAACVNSPGSFSCECVSGFGLDGGACVDVDDCLTDNGGCDVNATCTDDVGTVFCQCKPGYLGDGVTCQAAFQRVGHINGLSLSPEGFETAAVGVGTRIYFAPQANSPANQYFRWFDVPSGTVSPPLPLPPGPTNDFCACGYSEAFFSDGTRIFMLGNSGAVFDTTTSTWSPVAAWAGATRDGEMGAAWVADAGVAVMAGGRTNPTRALRFDGTNFTANEGTLPDTVSIGAAWTFQNTRTVYVANSGSSRDGLLRHTALTGVWQPLPAVPGGTGAAFGLGEFGGRLVWNGAGRLRFFDPATDTWGSGFVDVPGSNISIHAMVMAAGGLYFLVDSPTGIDVWRLIAAP